MSADVPHITVDLGKPPSRRWDALGPYVEVATRLLRQYLGELGGLAKWRHQIGTYSTAFIESGYLGEMKAVADMAGVSLEEAIVGNLYYDAMKIAAGLGCTAFAVEADRGPLHARNLDWWSEDGLLSTATLVIDYTGGAGAGDFSVVGWPGFVGALSGVAPGRFAVTLNAASSDEPAQLARPVTLLIRTVLARARSFEQAVATFRSTPLPCDCLLLVTGTEPGEMAVIERTPRRAMVRGPEDGRIVVANDYLMLPNSAAGPAVRRDTLPSRSRFDRATALVKKGKEGRAAGVAGCFEVLRDPAVMQGITAQQMVMSAATGELEVRLPEGVV